MAFCYYCGMDLHHRGLTPWSDRTRDHKIPRSRGGTDDPTNLVLACRSCNSEKGTRTPEEWAAAGRSLNWNVRRAIAMALYEKAAA